MEIPSSVSHVYLIARRAAFASDELDTDLLLQHVDYVWAPRRRCCRSRNLTARPLIRPTALSWNGRALQSTLTICNYAGLCESIDGVTACLKNSASSSIAAHLSASTCLAHAFVHQSKCVLLSRARAQSLLLRSRQTDT